MHSKPSMRDWALAAIGTMFVVMGLVILPHDLNTGVTTIAFFGACAAAGIATIVRKRRYARQSVEGVTVAGGVRIRPSRLRLALFGAGLLGLGVVLPWDRITRVAAGELHRNPALLLWLDGEATFQVTPHGKQGKFLKYVGQCRGWVGADMFLMTTHFGIDLPILVGAIGRYVGNREARAELAPT